MIAIVADHAFSIKVHIVCGALWPASGKLVEGEARYGFVDQTLVERDVNLPRQCSNGGGRIIDKILVANDVDLRNI